MADDTTANAFIFADHLVLDESPTREFYRSVLQGLIHKNNNTLGVIQGYSSLILMDEPPKSVLENVEQMKTSANHATELAKVILTAAGCARVNPEPTSLSDLLPHLKSKAEEKCAAAGVSLQFQAADSLPAIQADSTRLIELLVELIKNAAEAAAGISGGEVAIDILPPGEASSAEENCVDFFIRNSSVELTPEQIHQAFLPFEGNKSNDHYGLGLTTAGVLAGQMKMRLGLRNAEGTTTAWLSLPVAG